MHKTETACRTITIPIQKVHAFGPSVRAHLRDVLVPFPAPDGEPYAISKEAREVERDTSSYLWTGNAEDGFLDNAHMAHLSRDLMDRCGGAALHLDRDEGLFDRRNTLLHFRAPTNDYDVIFFPQGAVIISGGVASAMATLGQHEGKGWITPDIARRAVKVIEGRETSNHERIELLRASNAFISAYLAQEISRNTSLGEHHLAMLNAINLKVVAPD